MSKFHFLRTFREFTGVTPIRFLSAVRIDEAKRLLFATSRTVAEISAHVGYCSLGTFTRRFTECVGLAPTAYRRLARGMAVPAPDLRAPGRQQGGRTGAGTLSGTVTATAEISSPIFVGLFESRIPQGQPVVSTALAEPGQWRLPGVPVGSWHLLAAATAAGPGNIDSASAGRMLLVGTAGEIHIRPGTCMQLDVTVRPLDWTHPPLMVALPGVEVLRASAA